MIVHSRARAIDNPTTLPHRAMAQPQLNMSQITNTSDEALYINAIPLDQSKQQQNRIDLKKGMLNIISRPSHPIRWVSRAVQWCHRDPGREDVKVVWTTKDKD